MNHKTIVKKILVFAALVGIIAQTGCTAKPENREPVKKQSFYFDTVCTIWIYDMPGMTQKKADTVIAGEFELCNRFENLLSKTKEGTDIYKINHAQGNPVEVSPETLEVIRRGIEFGDLSGGKFDITVGKAVDLWDFHSDTEARVPEKQLLEEAVRHVDYKGIIIEGNSVRLTDPEMEIDLGGIAKGYIADKVCEDMKARGVTSAMVSLGGNLECVGRKKADTDFKAGIELPFSDMSEIIGTTGMNEDTLVTSGIYERYFEQNGKLYHHILDPETGYPVDTDVLGVSVKADFGKSTDCDALATICLMLGTKDGLSFISGIEGVEALFIDTDGTVTMTDGMEFYPAK